MLESLISLLDKFTPEILVILSGLLVITTTLFLWLWFANRRTYNLLRHQLPASVVKTYLDSVIQNSNTLKNALFRGDAGAEGAAVPVTSAMLSGVPDLMAQAPATSGAMDALLREQLQQKLAELAAIQAQLNQSNVVKKDLESNLAGSQARVKELEAMLANLPKGAGGGDAALAGELQTVTKERNELRDRLKEYEIIEDDLANLKRLQQENEQLKRALGTSDADLPKAPVAPPTAKPVAKASEPVGIDPLAGAADLFEEVAPPEDEAPAAALAEEAPALDPAAELEQFLSGGSEPVEAEAPAMEAAPKAAEPAPKAASGGSEKTPEDLLSEFEKMLG